MFERSLSTMTKVVVGIQWATTTTVVVGIERVTTTTVVVGIKWVKDSVQSSAGLLKVHIFRCFQKISLILCNSDIIFRITFIIKSQTSCGALVTL